MTASAPSTLGTVLFVDDEEPFRKIFHQALESRGYAFREAENVAQGWDLVQALKPQVVLLDMIMPGGNGIELLKKIRSNADTQHIPVVMFSVMGDKKQIQECLRAGADDYAIKGAFAPSEIEGIVSSLIQRHHKHQDKNVVLREGRLEVSPYPRVHSAGSTKHRRKKAS